MARDDDFGCPAGNGGLAEGFYRGIASDANVVLVKIGRTGRISEDEIQRGLEWVLDHAEEHQVRVINISAGGDFEGSYLTTPLSQAVERCVRACRTVVCAVGNAAQVPGYPVLPPASAPSCIALGGLNDHNSLDRGGAACIARPMGRRLTGYKSPK